MVRQLKFDKKKSSNFLTYKSYFLTLLYCIISTLANHIFKAYDNRLFRDQKRPRITKHHCKFATQSMHFNLHAFQPSRSHARTLFFRKIQVIHLKNLFFDFNTIVMNLNFLFDYLASKLVFSKQKVLDNSEVPCLMSAEKI